MAFFTHRSRLSILLIIFPCLLWGQEEEQLLRRVYDHLVIGDQAAAVYEGKQLLEAYPYSIRAQEAYLESLCQKGEEIEALELFSLLWEKQEESERRKAAEQLAWSVLFKGKASPLFLVHLYSILGSAFAHDAKAVPLLLQEMRGSNAFLRALAVKLSMNYGDEPLRRELLRLLQEERVWFVRLEVIRAVGALRITK
ncbi:MAG: hypothetical protein FJZ58_02240, partial [Chlamydiae bacterium]|nr:hypothetical protein [Chlamydiota bacterium]